MKKRKGVSVPFIAVLAVGLIALGVVSGGVSLNLEQFGLSAGTVTGQQGQQVDSAACGDDASCTVTIDVQNPLNETATETYDLTYYVKDDQGNVNQQYSDSTSNDVTLSPGVYTISVASGSTANANIVGASKGTINDDGTLTVRVDAENIDLTLQVPQHGGIEARAFDNDANAFLFTTVDSDAAGDFVADGSTFESSTNNTKLAVGSGGDLDITQTVRQDTVDEEFSDLGTIVAIAADTAKYDEPIVRWDGTRLTEQGASILTDEGQNAVSGTYDYYYRLPAGAFNDVDNPAKIKHELEWEVSALSGVDPGDADDIQVDFLSEGRYEEVGSTNDLAVSTHKDDTSFTAVHTIMDFTYDIN